MNQRPLLTICIPAYNRFNLLAPLLDSIVNQKFQDFNILICEDGSPERIQISQIVSKYQERYPARIRYHENEGNLGYDGNIRKLVELANGHYCLFMGNDDLLCEGSLDIVAEILNREATCGVLVRSYATFDDDPNQYKQVFRYFPNELVVNSGVQAITIAYRRSVVIPGMIIHRDSAAEVATNRFDGTLLYQLYLVGMILAKLNVVFTPNIIALRRDGIPPDFGNSAVEKKLFTPKEQTPESSLHFVHGMLNIAKYIEGEVGLKVFKLICADIGNYSYPILSIQARLPKISFIKYGMRLAKMGFWRYPLFYGYFLSLIIFGPNQVDKLIKFIKKRLGYTPRLINLKIDNS